MDLFNTISFTVSLLALIFGSCTTCILLMLNRKYEYVILKEYLIIMVILLAGYIHIPISFLVKDYQIHYILSLYYNITAFIFNWRFVYFVSALISIKKYKKVNLVLLYSAIGFWLLSTFNNNYIIVLIFESLNYSILLFNIILLIKYLKNIKKRSILESVRKSIKLLVIFYPIFALGSVILVFKSSDYLVVLLTLPYIVFILFWSLFNLSLINNFFFKPVNKNIHNKLDFTRLEVFGITGTEIEIVKLVISGLSNKEIAYTRNISERTVKNHLYNIFQKMEINSRIQLINFVIAD